MNWKLNFNSPLNSAGRIHLTGMPKCAEAESPRTATPLASYEFEQYFDSNGISNSSTPETPLQFVSAYLSSLLGL